MRLYFLFTCLLFWGCSLSSHRNTTDPYVTRAGKILETCPIIDTHVDFPYSLIERGEAFKPGYLQWAESHPGGDFDYRRAVKGGLYGPFMSVYIPVSYQKTKGAARLLADSLIDLVQGMAEAHPDKFALVSSTDDFAQNYRKRLVSLPMGMENGAPIESLADVAYFHRRGIRYVTLAHSRDNHISDSSYDTLHTHGGLSDFGREVVREMNRVGILVDISHLTDAAIQDVLEVSERPVIATHTACRHFTPGYARNIPDSLIRAVAARGGVIQVPFSHYFLSAESRRVYFAAEKAMKERGLDPNTEEARTFMRRELARSGIGVGLVADHIDHIRKIAGIEHIGLGSDFDGVGLALPPDLSDASMYPNLIAELLRRGYSDADIRKICSENTLRVWKQSERP